MIKIAIALILTTMGASLVAGSKHQPSTDPAIDAFWDKFKAAVTSGDKQAVFEMTQLPLDMGYAQSRIRTRAQFMKKYSYVFAGEVNAVKCFATAKPQVDKGKSKEFYVTCPFAENGGNEEPFVYTFKLTRSGWRFVSFENINE
jgi:hypothetical protein